MVSPWQYAILLVGMFTIVMGMDSLDSSSAHSSASSSDNDSGSGSGSGASGHESSWSLTSEGSSNLSTDSLPGSTSSESSGEFSGELLGSGFTRTVVREGKQSTGQDCCGDHSAMPRSMPQERATAASGSYYAGGGFIREAKQSRQGPRRLRTREQSAAWVCPRTGTGMKATMEAAVEDADAEILRDCDPHWFNGAARPEKCPNNGRCFQAVINPALAAKKQDPGKTLQQSIRTYHGLGSTAKQKQHLLDIANQCKTIEACGWHCVPDMSITMVALLAYWCPLLGGIGHSEVCTPTPTATDIQKWAGKGGVQTKNPRSQQPSDLLPCTLPVERGPQAYLAACTAALPSRCCGCIRVIFMC